MISSFSGKYRFLSNFWAVPITYEGRVYRSVEHAYQAAKTIDPEVKDKIVIAFLPAQAKRLGRKAILRPGWETKKLAIMEELLRLKFQHPGLREALLATEGEELIEGNTWGDCFWGACGKEGHNHLGNLLMKVRDSL